MIDEAAFIQTIREHPDDDGPRLVFADWLEERGQCERAEFIRVQIELARGVADPVRRQSLHALEESLLSKHARIWARSIGKWIIGWDFHRGLLAGIQIRCNDFVRHGDRLFDRAPIMKVRPNHLPDDLTALANCRALGRVRDLDLSAGNFHAQELQPILDSPYVKQLRLLDLGTVRIHLEGAVALFHSLNLQALKALDLSSIGLRGAWPRECPRLPNLIDLNLASNEIEDRGAIALVRSPIVVGLQRLNLSHCRIYARGAAAVARSKRLADLTNLDLSANAIGDAGAESLANSRLLNGLESLSLRDCDIGWAGAKAIAQSQMLEGLKHLDLSGNRLNSRQQNRLELRFGSRVKF